MANKNKKVGVFFDGDNVGVAYFDPALEYAESLGEISVVRHYRQGDQEEKGKWLDKLATHEGTSINSNDKTKNSVDVLIGMDAVGLAYEKGLNVAVIVSNDGDFAMTANFLKRFNYETYHVVGKGASSRLLNSGEGRLNIQEILSNNNQELHTSKDETKLKSKPKKQKKRISMDYNEKRVFFKMRQKALNLINEVASDLLDELDGRDASIFQLVRATRRIHPEFRPQNHGFWSYAHMIQSSVKLDSYESPKQKIVYFNLKE